MKRRSGKILKITLVRHIQEDLDQCEVEFENMAVFAFYPYAELNVFAGKEVEYVLRKDMVEGSIALVISEITIVDAIHTVEASNSKVKLITDSKRVMSTFDSKAVVVGNFYLREKFIILSCEHRSSQRAKWVDFTCVDKNSKTFYLRMFSDDNPEYYCKKLVSADIHATKYGLQTERINSYDQPLETSPEVALSMRLAQEYIENDNELLEFTKKVDYLKKLSEVVDYEIGIPVVRIAVMLLNFEAADNYMSGYDKTTLIRGIILSQLHRLPSAHTYTDDVKAILFLRQSKVLGVDDALIALLTGMDDGSSTCRIYSAIKAYSDKMMEVRYE